MGNACKQQALDIIEITQVDYISESQRNEHESIKIVIWDSKTERFLKTRLKIKKKLNKEIEYQEGCESFIKIDSFKNFSVRPKKSINLEYIQNHKWIGQYGKKMQKIGKWTESWKGQKLKGVGGYYSNDGKKEGYWNELIKNYWSRGQVQELGEYFNNQRRGVWKYIYFNNIIDGGLYNEQGQRNGKWTELSDKFWDCSQIIYHGEYKNGNKVGRWDIYFENKLIGGGQFYENQRSDVVKNVIKIGRWIEPSDWFYKL
ncbi:unnamed protein product [Paramecium sonneborni]|uniref:MORN repeat protein n=1 Tax=Paramecium sonneborni TaxID=65129 RepID=A0A8S1R9Z4_9CILI|nr:unnamed protein product [Paramecium sonneborni]